MKRSVMVFVLCFAFVDLGFAQTGPQVPMSRNASLDVGSVQLSGQTFEIVLDEKNIDRAYAEWARPMLGARTVSVSKDLFRSVVRETVSRKVSAMFPNGAPPDAALRVRINLDMNLGKPHDIGISIGC